MDVFTDTESRETDPETKNHQWVIQWFQSGEFLVFAYTISSFISAFSFN